MNVSLVHLPYLALSLPSPSSDLLRGSPVWSIQLTGVATSPLSSSINITFPHVEVSVAFTLTSVALRFLSHRTYICTSIHALREML